MDEKKLSDRMKIYRAKNRLSQRAFAKLCGISTQTLWSIEKGDQEPSEMTKLKIELVIGKEDCSVFD